jgi:hypothetical protein
MALQPTGTLIPRPLESSLRPLIRSDSTHKPREAFLSAPKISLPIQYFNRLKHSPLSFRRLNKTELGLLQGLLIMTTPFAISMTLNHSTTFYSISASHTPSLGSERSRLHRIKCKETATHSTPSIPKYSSKALDS